MVAQVAVVLVRLVVVEALWVWWTIVYIAGCCSCGFLLVDGYYWMPVASRRLQFLTVLVWYNSLEMNLICSVESSAHNCKEIRDGSGYHK